MFHIEQKVVCTSRGGFTNAKKEAVGPLYGDIVTIDEIETDGRLGLVEHPGYNFSNDQFRPYLPESKGMKILFCLLKDHNISSFDDGIESRNYFNWFGREIR